MFATVPEEIANGSVACGSGKEDRVVAASGGQYKTPRRIGADDGLAVRHKDAGNSDRPMPTVA
jgi:hypothetical protein